MWSLRTSVASLFVSDVSEIYLRLAGTRLTNRQIAWLSFCVGWMALLGTLNFAAFASASLGGYRAKALSWMLHHSKIDWQKLLASAVAHVMRCHKPSVLHLVIDDTDRPRSKMTRTLWGVFKTVDKATGGWIQAQNLVFLCIVTDKFTLPILFQFYRPDPAIRAWNREDKRLRKAGVKKSERPQKPERNSDFPTKIDIAGRLLQRCAMTLAQLNERGLIKIPASNVKSITFDCAYMSPRMARSCARFFPAVQVISQISSSQIVWDKSGIHSSVKEYFARKKPVTAVVKRRGTAQTVRYLSARLVVKSHGEILHVVALTFEGEEEYRYLVATKLSWRSDDIIRAYALRWLIEVANFDWKQHDGWGRSASQYGADGACRGVVLSLLVDSLLLTHHAQLQQSRAGLPLWTAGSVARRLQYDNLLNLLQELAQSQDPDGVVRELRRAVESMINFVSSSKHMVGIDVGDFGPTPSLKAIWG